jgi:penicillin G amidase
MGRLLFRLVLLALVILAAGFLWLRSSLPRNDGRLALAGLSAEVRIHRDARGVPTIRAASERDAALALGFVHAQDRLFQMDVMRRAGAGRLSEWFGAATLPTDRFMRILGLYRAAEQQYAQLSPELKGVLDAYGAGVNAFLTRRRTAWPLEYYLLNARPDAWRPADSLVWGKIMALQLAGNFRRELLRARLLKQVKPDDLNLLYPPYPGDAPIITGDAGEWLKGLPLTALAASLPEIVGPRFASNNWVVDGAHTASGKPLLANDPHLELTAPSIWYLARIETPSTTLAGVTSPGGPFVVLGHNARIAWGFTNTESDVEDLFIERLDPADPARYLTPSGSEPFTMRQETILVRGGAPERLTVRATRHGPVLSDVGGNFAATTEPDRVLALQTSWLTDDDRSPEALWAMAHAGNWPEFHAALKDFVAPQQNMVYADVDGNIGFFVPGRVPIRKSGEGWIPAPGWSGEHDWTGFVPFDALPSAFNPPSGRVVSANNKIVPDDFPYFLGRDWDIPNRARRINELLDYIPQQSPAAAAAMQADTMSLMARDLLPLMLAAKPSSPASSKALERLRAWDGRMDREQVAPLLFAAWLRSLNRVLLADRLGNAFDDYWGMRPDVIKLILTQHPDWCGNGEAAPEPCGAVLSRALEEALAKLGERFGTDMSEWRWGRAHEARFRNLFWSNVPLISRLVATTIPANGGDDTIDRGGTASASASAPFTDVHGPTLRMIADLDDLDGTRFMIAPGQSGNVLSPHYADLMRRWRDHDYLVFEDPSVDGFVLVPR